VVWSEPREEETDPRIKGAHRVREGRSCRGSAVARTKPSKVEGCRRERELPHIDPTRSNYEKLGEIITELKGNPMS